MVRIAQGAAFTFLITLISATAVKSSPAETDNFAKLSPRSPSPTIPQNSASLLNDPGFLSTLETSFRERSLSKRQGIPIRDDLLNGKCNDVILIFARGTGGIGNIGLGLGPSFVSKVEAALPGRVIVQGVLPYAADVLGYLQGGSAEGGRSMKSLTERAASQCPDAQIVLSGYSQGAQVTHIAAGLLSPSIYPRIAAIVTFGDPKQDAAFPGILQSRSLVICNIGDLICEGQPVVGEEHSSEAYESRMPEAVRWITAKIPPPRPGPKTSSLSKTTTAIESTSVSAATETGTPTVLGTGTSTDTPPAETSTSTGFSIKIPRVYFLAGALIIAVSELL